MQQERFNDPIRVGAIFFGGNIRPVWFEWRGVRYNIARITYSWQDRQGMRPLQCFSVTDGVNIFEICFDAQFAEWRIKGSCSMG